jgi:hypothetical protein
VKPIAKKTKRAQHRVEMKPDVAVVFSKEDFRRLWCILTDINARRSGGHET